MHGGAVVTGPHDTDPPPSVPPTGPLPLADEPSGHTLPAIELPIARGEAKLVVTAAFLEVLSSLHRLEAVCQAVARQLDSAEAKP
jgi:hypothetical protein